MRNVHDLMSLYEKIRREPQGVNGDYQQLMDGLLLFPSQFAYVIDYTKAMIKAHRGFDTVLGFHPADVNLLLLFRNHFHPEDQIQLNEIIYRAIEWATSITTAPFGIYYSADYRVKRSDGSYIRVMRQSTITETDSDGKMISTLSICTDISHLKKNGKIIVKAEGPNAKAALFEEEVNERPADKKKIVLSVRELEIVRLIALGKTSQEVGDKLGISVNTVNTHRRNILDRSERRNMTQLIMEAIEQNLI